MMPPRKAPRDQTSVHVVLISSSLDTYSCPFLSFPTSLPTWVEPGTPWNFGIHDFGPNQRALFLKKIAFRGKCDVYLMDLGYHMNS